MLQLGLHFGSKDAGEISILEDLSRNSVFFRTESLTTICIITAKASEYYHNMLPRFVLAFRIILALEFFENIVVYIKYYVHTGCISTTWYCSCTISYISVLLRYYTLTARSPETETRWNVFSNIACTQPTYLYYGASTLGTPCSYLGTINCFELPLNSIGFPCKIWKFHCFTRLPSRCAVV